MPSTLWGSKKQVRVIDAAADEALGTDLPASDPVPPHCPAQKIVLLCPDTPVASKEIM